MGEMSGKDYRKALEPLQEELNVMHRWLQHTGQRLVVLFEGRDTAGKGGAINAIADCLNPRACRVVALSKPSDREKTQWYFQRYVEHLPSAGEIVLFDRSWYNRAGVEKVMGFCNDEEYRRFLEDCPRFERMLVDNGILLFKYWFACDQQAQEERLAERLSDPVKRWKISPIDLAARGKYRDYTAARDAMFEATDVPEAPWTLVDMNDQKRGRLNFIRHLLDHLPDHEVALEPLELPPLTKKPAKESYPKRVARAKAVY
ncbi:MAG: polyphosphate kinase 2 [Rhodanobacteraceae bacterium]|nr:polyphosphate kinase 2 [Rhodanobacteraceae bacterium]